MYITVAPGFLHTVTDSKQRVLHRNVRAEQTLGCTAPCYHAKNKIAGRFIPFFVLGFGDKNTGICAGAMPYRRYFPATTRI